MFSELIIISDYKIADINNSFTVLDESILNADVCITLSAFVSPANYFINEIYNLFPCNIGKLGEHSSRRETTRLRLVFPDASRVLPTSRVLR